MSDEEKRATGTDRRRALLSYLFILFCAAFLLVLLSFVRQLKQNNATISELSQTSTSALANAQRLQDENTDLRGQVDELQDQVDRLQSRLNMVNTESTAYKNRVVELQTALSEAESKLKQAEENAGLVQEEAGATLQAYQLLVQLLRQTDPAAAAEIRAQLEPLSAYLDEDALAVFRGFSVPEAAE